MTGMLLCARPTFGSFSAAGTIDITLMAWPCRSFSSVPSPVHLHQQYDRNPCDCRLHCMIIAASLKRSRLLCLHCRLYEVWSRYAGTRTSYDSVSRQFKPELHFLRHIPHGKVAANM